ncbi:hypothetical protein GMA3_38 [Gordonia phage GMA3]|uniref:MazG-like nucleotide pyrophosphohydrolase n=1 Tax=Gordonia phage GMA3 TaxID=1647284 RepID=A0A0K0NKI9_9CAUD|nr:pyrophosphatase [Gordonia phage GMA3]AKL88215.1 hypothetical protein GMA3_38 [Gordonia phage GMA3]
MTDLTASEKFFRTDNHPVPLTRDGHQGYDPATGVLTDEGAAEIASALTILFAASWTMAEQKGFHESERGFPEEVALMHSELSEALESYRNGEPFIWYRDKNHPDEQFNVSINSDGDLLKPEGISSEFTDVIIRIGDSVGGDISKIGEQILSLINKNRYNGTRPYKHGKVC